MVDSVTSESASRSQLGGAVGAVVDAVKRKENRARKGAKSMKYIIAVVKPHRLDEIRSALTSIGVEGMTVSDVKGFGRQKGHSEVYRGAEYQVDFVPKVKLEIAIEESQAAKVVEAIRDAAKTDRIGDGKIFVLDLEDAVRVRTGESGAAAL